MARTIGFLVVPDFSMVGFLCAVSVFRNANRAAGREFYTIEVISERAEPVTASVGITVTADADFGSESDLDLIFVCAGQDPAAGYSRALGGWLRRKERSGVALGAISTGADLLARAGLLRGYRCTIYWEQAAAFAEEFPDIEVTNHIYEIDRTRFTCGGATSSIDLCLQIVLRDLGPQVAAAVSSTFVVDRVRNAEEPQFRELSTSLGELPARLTAAIAAMESGIEDPLGLESIAAAAAVTPRHLTRLFRHHLDTSPGDYYLRLRLTRARQYLRQTRMTAQEVSVACGFRSAAHFATAYRRQFGHTPRQARTGTE